MKQVLILTIGNIGCGKTTLTNHLHKNIPNTMVINNDQVCYLLNNGEYRADDWIMGKQELYWECMSDMMDNILRKGYNLIIDSTFHTQHLRDKFLAPMLFRPPIQKVGIIYRDHEAGLIKRASEGRGHSYEYWKEVHDRIQAEWEEPKNEFDLTIELQSRLTNPLKLISITNDIKNLMLTPNLSVTYF